MKDQYCSGSGLHAHHIKPKHDGGTNEAHNLTYLTPREHKIAHFLLWKIHNNPNDLRSLHMLGAELTAKQRRTVGIFCRDNQLGFFSASKELRDEGRRKAAKQAHQHMRGIHDPVMKPVYASLGGKASWKSENNIAFRYWASPEGRKRRSEMGAAKSARYPVTDGSITKKLKTPEERIAFLAINPNWRSGTHHSPRKGVVTNRPSPRRRTVNIEGVCFPSVHAAAQHFDVTPSTIINRCKSNNTRWVNWEYSS